MDTYLKNMERTETVSVEDLKRDLLSEFSDIKAVTQDSSTLLEREHLQVYLRIRPFTSPEMEDGEAQDCVTIQHPDTVLLKPPRASISGRQSDKNVPQTAQRFQFSQVYGPEASQKDMFDGTVKSLVKDVLEGRNSLVFTYGVTNAGKTFTFIGPEGKSGILPRSLNMIFSSIEGHVFTHMSLKPHRCREYLTLSEEQQKEEASSKRSLLRLLKENDGHKSLSQLSSKTSLEGSMRDMDGLVNEESFSLDLGVHTEFSVWVSFCEIYNENIHDLLEPLPSGSVKRTILRLSQDVKGNAFIKDLKWVQVNSADEALRVLKLGKRNQSISSTKLNHLSSRSHSIFSIRILRIEDVGVPRFQTVSELSLCDLAGSERCAKTQNKGERLKEAANINTSLLSLGKCINALRNNQQARQHVPFRESKLTHYLQGFFTGRGKACMIVNINQCASMYDETLNVLKFSAVAQKVVVLTTKIIPVVVKKSAREVSFIINNADRQMIRRSSMVRWDTSRLEDVQEDAVSEEEESMMEDTFQEDEGKETVILDKDEYEAQVMFLEEVQGQLEREKASNLILEADIREEVTKEFTELFSQMEQDYKERLAKERELVEERCERRLEIFKNLIRKNSNEEEDEDAGQPKTEGQLSLDGMLDFMCGDLAGIRQNAEEAHSCLVTSNNLQQATITLRNLERKVTELTEELDKTQGLLALKTQELESRCGQLNELEETKGTLLCHEQRMREMVEMCGQKDEMISRLQTSLDQHVKDTSKDKVLINTIREEILEFQKNCTCSDSHGRGSRVESRKRRQEGEGLGDVDGQPPQKKGPVGDADIPDSPLHGAVDEVRGQLDRMVDLERKCQALEFCNRELKTELKEAERCRDNALVEKDRLSVELIALQGNTEEQQSKLLAVELQLAAMEAKLVAAEKEHSTTKADLSMESQLAEANKAHEALRVAQARLAELDCEVREKTTVTEALRQDVARLKQEAEASCALRSDLQVVRAELCDARQESESRRARVQLLELQLKATTHTQHTQHTQPSEVLTLREEEVEERKVENAKKEGLLLGKEEELSQREADLIGQQRGRRESQEPKRDETETESNLSNREAQLMQKEATLAEKEAQLSGLERSLKEVQERLEEGEMQAVQQARRREVERRRELLAVAEEAIAQKEAELKKREEEVDRLKEEIRSCSDKMKGLTVDLQRREEDSSDLKEKLTDSKKQIQQVQREISSMRDAEKSLRQKFADLEKSKAQLQSDVSCRDRTIQQLKSERASDPKAEEHLRLYRKACEDLQARERVMEDMRLALTEQEETQTQLDVELEARDEHIRELTQELEVLKGLLLEQRTSRDFLPSDAACSDDVTQAREEATRAQESFKMVVEKHQAERRKWLEEKMDLIRLAKEAEERRNQDMRRFADGRERHARQQTELESLSARLSAREQEMEAWRRERDTLVSALEVQLQKLLSSNAEKDEQIQALRCSDTRCTPEGAGGKAEELQRLLAEREAELCGLKEQLHTTLAQRTSLASQHRDSSTQTLAAADPVVPRPLDCRALNHRDGPRGSVSSQGSSGSGPSVLDSSQISTETGHRSRFPRPELEISFSPLQPDRFALKRQGDASAVTVKIARTARKRKSGEMEKKRSSRLSKAKPKVAHHQQTPQDGIENRRNTRTRNTPRLMAHEEEPSPAFHVKAPQSSQSSLRGKKEGTFQKIGDFLQSSPTFLGSKAKRIMGLVSGKSPDGEGGGSLSLKPKRYKRKLYRPQISSPLDIPVHPIVGRDPEEKESDHLIIKRRLRARTGK